MISVLRVKEPPEAQVCIMDIEIREIVKRAVAEDVGAGDITTRLTIPENATASGIILAKVAGILAGMRVAALCFEVVDPTVAFAGLASDGARIEPGQKLATVSGSARSILTGERVALNFLQRMSGIATMTGRFVDAVAGTSARIVDTRKTTPGLRVLEKYAVRAGGGFNHRFGLDDGILIKDNHIAVAGGVAQAVRLARAGAPHTLKVEVEVQSLAELDEALRAQADAVLLDNMSTDEMRQAVSIVGGRAIVEASGCVEESSVATIAATGVDIISVGKLTHSFRSIDISLDITTGPSSEKSE
jgi:nicotinate-nucleotide pyrophosphorylase (carboxylating)